MPVLSQSSYAETQTPVLQYLKTGPLEVLRVSWGQEGTALMVAAYKPREEVSEWNMPRHLWFGLLSLWYSLVSRATIANYHNLVVFRQVEIDSIKGRSPKPSVSRITLPLKALGGNASLPLPASRGSTRLSWWLPRSSLCLHCLHDLLLFSCMISPRDS